MSPIPDKQLLACAEALDSLCAWLLRKYGLCSPEGREAMARRKVALAALTKAKGEQG